MRIATSQLYDRSNAQMASLSSRADLLQTQISTGTKVTKASDDTPAWTQIQSLKRADASDAAWETNVKTAQGLLTQADSTLESVESQLQRAQELTIAAANGTLNETDRAATKAELDSIIESLVGLANSRDARGQPIFGGSESSAPFVKNADGSIGYAGSGEPPSIPIGQDQSMVAGVTGDRAFGDMFATLTAISAALGAGEAPASDAVEDLQAATDQVAVTRASIGARGARLELYAGQLTEAKTDRADERQELEATDITAAITELQQTLTILQATQASFTKLSSLSLFDSLR